MAQISIGEGVALVPLRFPCLLHPKTNTAHANRWSEDEICFWRYRPIFRDELLVFKEGKLQESWKSVDVC